MDTACASGGKGSERMYVEVLFREGKGDGTLVQGGKLYGNLVLVNRGEKRNGIVVQRREERWNLSLGEGRGMEL